MDSYFAGFDLLIKDTDGIETPLANYVLTIAYSTIEIEVESDDNGFVFGELLTDIPPESEIEIYDDSGFYAGVLTQITKADALQAMITNKANRFIIEDDYTTTTETELVDIYIRDLNGNVEPEYVGTVRPGETLEIPYESVADKNLRIYKIEKDSGFQRRVTDLAQADYVDFSPASSRAPDEIIVGTTVVENGTDGYVLINDNGVLGEIDPGSLGIGSPMPTNWALASNGSTASATNTAGANFAASRAIDGYRHTNNNWNSASTPGGGWDGTGSPNYFEIDFGQNRTIYLINIFTLADAINYTTEPTLSDTFSSYGIVDFDVEYWNGASWVLIVSVTGNNKVWRQFTFAYTYTSKIRVKCINSLGDHRIVEVEAIGI